MAYRYDLSFDPNEVGADLVAECWISQGPRANDPEFDPQPSDWLMVSDDEGEPLRARVARRLDDRVWVHIDLATWADALA